MLKAARWLTDKYIIVMLLVFPLFWGTVGYEAITRPKFLFFAIATGVWGGAIALMLIIGLLRGERYDPQVRASHIFMALYLVAGAVSACFSQHKDVILSGAGRYDGYVTILLYGLIFFGVSMLAVPRRRYVWALGLAALVCGIVAALQLAGFDPMGLYPPGTTYADRYEAYNGAFLGTIGNSGLFAAFLCAAGPFLTVYGLLTEHSWERVLLLPGGLSLVLMLLCDIDAALVALAGCVLISVPVLLKNRRARNISLAVGGGTVCAGLGFAYFWPGTEGTLWQLSRLLHGELVDEFGTRRGEIWKQCFALIKQRPWLGYGPGTAASVLDIHWSRYIESLGRDRNVFVDNTHNVFLNVLLTTGIIGLALYLGAIVCSLITWFRRRHDSVFHAALGCAFVCYLIQDFFGIGLCVIAPVFWVLWGLLESDDSGECGLSI